MVFKTEKTKLNGILGIFSGCFIGNFLGTILSFYVYSTLNPYRLNAVDIILLTVTVYMFYSFVHNRAYSVMKKICPTMPEDAKCAVPLNMLFSVVLFKKDK